MPAVFATRARGNENNCLLPACFGVTRFHSAWLTLTVSVNEWNSYESSIYSAISSNYGRKMQIVRLLRANSCIDSILGQFSFGSFAFVGADQSFSVRSVK